MVSSLTTALNSNVYSSLAQQSSHRHTVVERSTQPNSPAATETRPGQFTDTVSISDAARRAAENATNGASTQYYEQFLPTYEGFSATAIAEGVSDPGFESFSAGKSLEQVAIDARANLDNNYERLKDIGKLHEEGSEYVNSLLGELDRRALYAVSSNEGGMFTREEQNLAHGKLSQQQGLAMGLYSGPTSEKNNFHDPFFGDKAQQFKAGIEFLDKVSSDEKAGSIEFSVQRAALQRGYESITRSQGNIPEDVSSDHPLVNLILAARDAVNGDLQRGQTLGTIRNVDDLRRQPWFEGFENRLDDTIQKTRDQYLL